MASTNTNTGVDTSVLSTDIYEISDFIDQIRQDNITNVSETASMVGIFGYMNEIFSQSLQNTLIVVSETSNETIATKAKFSKNIITHALNLGINDINSKPAVMTMMIYMPVSYVENNFSKIDSTTGKATFIFDKNVPIFIDNFEFHLDYDIIFTRIKNVNGKYVYTAMYDLFEPGTTIVKQKNPISDITNPYITTLVNYTLDGVEYLAFSARLHQVSIVTIEKNILTNNSIENKAVTFDFDDQLAAFDVDVIENNTITHLTPVFSGLLDYTIEDKWCYYEYIDENTIRIIFDRDSYVPSMNATVNINVKLSSGSDGNFTYTQNFRSSMRSEKYNDYNGMYILVHPLLNGISSGGKNKKSIEDLKKIIPREASSRGAVINTTDLNNFFNSINDDECKLYFRKKRDNPFERMYYSYMLMRKDATVYPTNTLDLDIVQSNFKGYAGNNNLSLSPGTIFYYYNDPGLEANYASVVKPDIVTDEDRNYEMVINSKGEAVRLFEYISPFLITIDDDLISSYLLTIMNETKTFKFIDINTNSNLQFVATNMNWSRKFIYDDIYNNSHVYDNKYVMDVSIAQNNNNNYNLVKYHINGNNDMVFDDVRIKVFMVLYADETDNNPYRYTEATLTHYSASNFIYDFRFVLETDDLMDLNNRINIKNLNNAKPEALQHKSIVDAFTIGNNIKYVNVYEANDDSSSIVGVIEDLDTRLIVTKYNNNYGYIEYPYTGWVKLSELENATHGYMNSNTYAKIFILADFGTKAGDRVNGFVISEDDEQVILYQNEDEVVSNPGYRNLIEDILPTKADVLEKLFNNDIYFDEEDGTRLTIVNIIKSNKAYMAKVNEYNNNEQDTEAAILKYLRNNKNSEYVKNIILEDEDVKKIIDSYSYEDLSRYTLCNVLAVDNGIDFYHDYTNIMTSNVIVEQIQNTDTNGNLVYKSIPRTDSLGNNYIEYKPIYKTNENGTYHYNYKVKRIPMIKNNFLNTEEKMQDFIFDLEERRKYMNECLAVLEDTFSVDLKFFNTFGPSKLFYYNVPSAKAYAAKVGIKRLNVYRVMGAEDETDDIVGTLLLGQEIHIKNTKGQWGYIEYPYTGWVKLSGIVKTLNYIDNTALTMKFALEAQSSADKYIANNIVYDVKEFLEDINEVTELHVPNIITLITNNYREQLIYFEFLDVNNYGVSCQHLYLTDTDEADICPEFLNIETDDYSGLPKIDIAVY